MEAKMNGGERFVRRLLRGAVIALWCAACASQSKGQGSETHFGHCTTDQQCTEPGTRCVAGECTAEADGASSPPDAAPPNVNCGPMPGWTCTQFCGSDRIADPECNVSQWTCPDYAPQRTDECSPDTCSGPPFACCGNGGVEVPPLCIGGSYVCPPGASEPDPVSGCPSMCTAPAAGEGPHAVTFQFTNASNAPIAMWQGCQLEHEILGCVDGYTEPLPTAAFCMPQCPGSCVTCGPCNDAPLVVTSTQPALYDWEGFFVAIHPQPACSCYERLEAVPGRYRITVPVYPAEPLTQEGGGWYRTALYEVSVDFVLPAAGGIVEVPLDASTYIDPCPAGGGGCLARLSPDDPASGCTPAPSTEQTCPSFAPRRFLCEAPVPLDELCVDDTVVTPGTEPPDGVIRCCP